MIINQLVILHSHNILHGDINDGNIVVSEDGYAFLIDWGLPKEIGE